MKNSLKTDLDMLTILLDRKATIAEELGTSGFLYKLISGNYPEQLKLFERANKNQENQRTCRLL